MINNGSSSKPYYTMTECDEPAQNPAVRYDRKALPL